ncbi:MAG: hypothetical protein ISS19_00150 [Bacteroidales bacterium]|nr:hypothetical protein [Bacteroidales bacterium]
MKILIFLPILLLIPWIGQSQEVPKNANVIHIWHDTQSRFDLFDEVIFVLRDEGYVLSTFDKYCYTTTALRKTKIFSTENMYRILVDVEDQLVVLRIEWYDKYEYPDWERGYYHRIKRSQPREYWNILVDFAEKVVDEVGGEVHYLVEE